MAAPVSADAPTVTTDSVTFPDINPCTGNEHDVTINLVISEHLDHKRSLIRTVKRTGTTSSGYVMDHGTDSQIYNSNVGHINHHDTWRNDEGSIFQAHVSVVFNHEGFLVENSDWFVFGHSTERRMRRRRPPTWRNQIEGPLLWPLVSRPARYTPTLALLSSGREGGASAAWGISIDRSVELGMWLVIRL